MSLLLMAVNAMLLKRTWYFTDQFWQLPQSTIFQVPLDRPCPVPHPEVGRYFKCLHPTVGYIPNAELALEYPDENQLSRGPVNSF